MSLSDPGVIALLAGLALAGVVAGFFWPQVRGILQLWRFLFARQKQFEQRRDEKISPQETQAIEVVLETCSSYRKEKLSHVEGLR